MGGLSFLSFTFLPAALLLARCARVCVGPHVRVYLFIRMRSTFLQIRCLLMKIKEGFVIGVSPASIRAANEVEFKAPPLPRPSLIVPRLLSIQQSLFNPRLIAIMTFSRHNSPDVSLIGIHSQCAPINRPHLSSAPSEQRVLACALRQIVSQLQLYHIILLSSFTGIEKL